ncbi:hypothetical protein C5Z25_11760 [Lactobacillus sp. CBA3605]|uniref:hypothetical protein n=1 Tax=Lactobacillus sp. CBA3605 TaxID=2099788 RepID=UPI000CFC2CCB|nr:hypothetical protein [Lactobacillus sp. CBA3605]AVK62392.1 hypothetical protein C5Z25_11760 [Lactobacillus sp. CBA3605]
MEKKDVMQTYVTDSYFGSGHFLTKIWQTIMVIIFWICVAVPVYWTISSTLLINNHRFLHAWRYEEGRTLFYFFDRFFIIAFIILAIIVIISTVHNNHRVKQHVEKKIQYDDAQLQARKQQLETFYTTRFADRHYRETVRNYHVKPEQNLEINEIHKLYKEED